MTLFFYAFMTKWLFDARIQKSERPDFIITTKDGKRIGLEVTRFTTEGSSIISKVLQKYADSGLSLAEINQKARRWHGRKAESLRFGKFDDGVLWGYDQSDYLIDDAPFIDIVSGKIKKYGDIVSRFDKFIILCDAQDGITYLNKTDVENLFLAIEQASNPHSVTLSVLYKDDSGCLHFEERDM